MPWPRKVDAPSVLPDGRTKPLAEIRAGDRIYGTARVGTYRRYVTTEVLDLHHVDRGYEDIEGRLAALGAEVHREQSLWPAQL